MNLFKRWLFEFSRQNRSWRDVKRSESEEKFFLQKLCCFFLLDSHKAFTPLSCCPKNKSSLSSRLDSFLLHLHHHLSSWFSCRRIPSSWFSCRRNLFFSSSYSTIHCTSSSSSSSACLWSLSNYLFFSFLTWSYRTFHEDEMSQPSFLLSMMVRKDLCIPLFIFHLHVCFLPFSLCSLTLRYSLFLSPSLSLSYISLLMLSPSILKWGNSKFDN